MALKTWFGKKISNSLFSDELFQSFQSSSSLPEPFLRDLFAAIQEYYKQSSPSFSSSLEAILRQQFTTAEHIGMIKQQLMTHEEQLKQHEQLYHSLLSYLRTLEQRLTHQSLSQSSSPLPAQPPDTQLYLARVTSRALSQHSSTENHDALHEIAYQVEQKIGIPPHRYKYIPYLAVYFPRGDPHLDLLQKELQSSLELYPPKEYHLPQPFYPSQPSQQSQIIFEPQWNLVMVEAQKAWEVFGKGKGSKVGIIDTGVDYTHYELHERFDHSLLGYNFVSPGYPPFDDHGHGTHVAGTVAGNSVGVAPEAQLYALKVLNRDGYGTEAHVIAAIEWALDHHLDIINMSLGSSRASKAEEEICKVAFEKGLVLVAAAGNRGDWSYEYPASHYGVISVAALTEKKRRAEFSNRNDRLDIAAPGVHVYSTTPGGMYGYKSGTSMATPHVTGVLALALAYKKISNKTLEEVMKQTAESLGAKDEYGAGLVRAYHLMDYLK